MMMSRAWKECRYPSGLGLWRKFCILYRPAFFTCISEGPTPYFTLLMFTPMRNTKSRVRPDLLEI